MTSQPSPLASLLGGITAAPAPLTTTAAVAATIVAATTTLDVTSLLVPLMSHQVEAVERIHHDVDTFGGSYVGDDMGLGKTFEAIAAIALRANSYPALIVCPPTLRLNWRNEIRRLVPDATVEVLMGTKPTTAPAPAMFYVMGDSTLTAWAGFIKGDKAKRTQDRVTGMLTTMGIRALVVDEAHRYKNHTAARSRAAIAFAKTLPAGALRLCMSGTAVVNRPSELATQMQIAGVDRVFGGWYSFLERYCPVVDQWGTRGVNEHLLPEMHRKLVDTFYLRRLRTEVLDLPGKGRQLVGTEMKGAAARAYVRAQDDLIAYLRGAKGKVAAEKASRAEAIVKLGTLRNLCGLAKIEAVVDYVQDLVDQGEQVFVAAWHTEVVDAIVEAFGALVIKGGVKDQARQDAVEAFQSGACRVLVGNIIAASEGLTLTAARHVVIAELPWTPGTLAQVEDRLDRIGQTREVVSHIMLGTNGIATVDERIMAILNQKALVTSAVMDGTPVALIDDEGIEQALLSSYGGDD